MFPHHTSSATLRESVLEDIPRERTRFGVEPILINIFLCFRRKIFSWAKEQGTE